MTRRLMADTDAVGLGVNTGNHGAIDLYKRLGFHEAVEVLVGVLAICDARPERVAGVRGQRVDPAPPPVGGQVATFEVSDGARHGHC